jgi:uncharacterized repeat protein (TIGR03803 family)
MTMKPSLFLIARVALLAAGGLFLPGVVSGGSLPIVFVQGAGGNFSGKAGGVTALSGTVGQTFTYQIVAAQTPATFADVNLPPGLSLDSASGLITGTPTVGAISSVPVTVTTATTSTQGTLVFTIMGKPAFTSILTTFGTSSVPFAYQLAASGVPSSYGAVGLPTGLSINAANGFISGTPTTTGTFSVAVTATNGIGTASGTLTLTISSTAPTTSQEYVLLHNFADGSVSGEGAYPGTLVQAKSGTFYGMTAPGGAAGAEANFALASSGSTGVFAGLGGAAGSTPAHLIQAADGNFYGTTPDGGSAHLGTIFKVTSSGTLTILHTFGAIANDGANPQAGVIQGADGNFYGTTQFGGTANLGTIFEMNAAGQVTILHNFGDNSVSNDGAQPVTSLVQDTSGNFYGTTVAGGTPVADSSIGQGTTSDSIGHGTIFSLATNGTVTILHSFGAANDGRAALSALIYHGGILYGTTNIGGTAGMGILFKITTSGVLTTLHNFGDGSVANDGLNPVGTLVAFDKASGGTALFGATQGGGTAGEGTVYEFDLSGALTILHNFDDVATPNDGQLPTAGLTLGADGNLYGTTIGGGAGYGTAYAIAANLNGPPSSPTTYTLTGTLPAGLTFDSSNGNIIGTPLYGNAIGGYAVSIASVVNGHAGTPQTVSIDLAQPFSTWTMSNFSTAQLADPSASSTSSTPLNDATSNLLKFLCGIDPTTPMTTTDRAALPTVNIDTTTTPGTEYLTLQYRHSASSDVDVVLEVSSDLQTWSPVASPAVNAQTGTDQSTGDPIMEVGVPISGTAPQFLRLNVSAP